MRAAGVPVLLACACLPLAGAAYAQGEEEEESATAAQEIEVIAPRPIRPQLKEDSPGRGRDAVISLKMTVQYGDLDLTAPKDVDRLMVRIRSVARDACTYLDRLYPLDQDPDCEHRAVEDTRPQVDEAIATLTP